jgi:hypothetical protein
LDKGVSGDVGLVIKVHESIENLVSVFTEVELIYSDYRRHTEAHVNQRPYDLSWSRNKSGLAVMSDRRRIPALSSENFSIDALNAPHDRVCQAHQLNDRSVAVAFARRLRAPAESPISLAAEFCT